MMMMELLLADLSRRKMCSCCSRSAHHSTTTTTLTIIIISITLIITASSSSAHTVTVNKQERRTRINILRHIADAHITNIPLQVHEPIRNRSKRCNQRPTNTNTHLPFPYLSHIAHRTIPNDQHIRFIHTLGTRLITQPSRQSLSYLYEWAIDKPHALQEE